LAVLLLGIDIGTSGVKAALFTPEGRIEGLAGVAYRVDTPHAGWAEVPPERWWRAMTGALKLLARERPDGLKSVGAVGFSVLFPALVPLDAAGRPLRSAILYCDQRSTDQVAALARHAPLERLERQTANRIVPGTCSATSMLWIRDRERGVYRRTKFFGHANTYVVARLTGRIAMDKSNASLTGLARMGREERFSARLVERFGLDGGKLPEVLPSAAVAGCVTARAARATGLPRGTPVVMGAGDAPAAAFGAGLAHGDKIFCVAGSSDCAVLATSTPPTDSRFANCAYCVEGAWVSIATQTSTGAAVAWFARSLLPPGAGAADVERVARGSAPGAGGVIFLPYLQGERTPHWDPLARGVFFGMSLATGRSEAARAVLEGTALGLREAIEALEASYGRRGARMFAVGGSTRNRLWMQIKASALNRPIHVLEFQEFSTLGAALLAGLGTGVYKSASSAFRATAALRRYRTVHPVPGWRRLYAEAYPVYRRLYGSLKRDFRMLGELSQKLQRSKDK